MSSNRRKTRAGTVALAVGALILASGAQVAISSPAQAEPMQVDSAAIGWEGDWYAAMAHRDGSFDIQARDNLTARFGIYNDPSSMQWFNAGGFYPALVTQFERDNSTVKITNFGDRITVGGRDFVAVYSRVSVYNHGSVARTLDPAPSANLLALTSRSKTVQPGQTVNHDYVVATDRFGNDYAWPANADLIAAGGYDAHYQHMTSYWDSKLAGIAGIDVPDTRLNDAYKAGYIYLQIVKDGNNLNVGENGYDQIFDHDLIGMLVSLFEQGDLSNAKAYLATMVDNQYPDAGYKWSWPWAVYLQKTGDTQHVLANFAGIKDKAHAITAAQTGPGGTMKASEAVDTLGHWTVDSQSALLGLLAYRYLAGQVGQTAEAAWAKTEYDNLFAKVNTQLQATITANGLSYLPCAVDQPNTANRCFQSTNDANWAATFLFGRWNWDGLLFGAAQTGPMATLLDATYDAGFAHLTGLPKHTYGGYPGYSSAYNAGYGEAALAGKKYRSEGIYGYQFMINNTQSAPYSWWEGIPTAGTTNWGPGSHATGYPTGSSPHMWGQANNSKVLLNSLVAEKSDGKVIVGRGIPNEWLTDNRSVKATNFPIAGNRRMAATISSTGNGKTVSLKLSGAVPAGGVQLSVPAFIANIASTTAGSVDYTNGIVTLPRGTTDVTVTLQKAPTLTELGGVNLDGYCQSIGNIGGVVQSGTGVYSWQCVTSADTRVGLRIDDACAWEYRVNPGAIARYSDVNNAESWKCYSAG